MQSEEQKRKSQINRLEFFGKHIIEGKSVTQCSKELGVQRTQLQVYKREADFRQMAIQQLESNDMSVAKTVSALVELCHAEKPVTLESVDKDGSSHQEIKWVADNNARDKAIGKVMKIYGLEAAKQTDVNVEVSFASDTELFDQIEEAARACKFVQTYERRKDGFELVADPSKASKGDFESRQRTLLQGTPVPEPERHESELAVSDNLEHANVQRLRSLRS